jgi:hypothetical protein
MNMIDINFIEWLQDMTRSNKISTQHIVFD